MPLCPSCHSEYEDWVQVCADCGVPLETKRAPQRDLVRSMFRPIGAAHTHPPPLPAGGGSAQPSSRYQGRNRRLKHSRAYAPPPIAAPLPIVLPVVGLGNAQVLPLNFDLHRPTLTYDPAGDAWVILITAPNEIIAQLVRSQLADAGVPALIKLAASADNGEFINNQWVPRAIWIQARDVDRAREVVEFYHSGSPITEAHPTAPANPAAPDDNIDQLERDRLYETPWLPTDHYEDPDMVAANASVDERGRPHQTEQWRNPTQRPWFRWLTFLLLLAWASPYLLDVLQHLGDSLRHLFGG